MYCNCEKHCCLVQFSLTRKKNQASNAVQDAQKHTEEFNAKDGHSKSSLHGELEDRNPLLPESTQGFTHGDNLPSSSQDLAETIHAENLARLRDMGSDEVTYINLGAAIAFSCFSHPQQYILYSMPWTCKTRPFTFWP